MSTEATIEAKELTAAQKKKFEAEIREQVAALAVELASDLLRKGGSSAPSGVFLQQLERQLKDMPAEERERLQKDLAADSARLTVITAAPLTPEEQGQWTDMLSDGLGQGEKADFATDPEILGGAELRFPHAVLKLTWADQLRKAKELLRRDDAAS